MTDKLVVQHKDDGKCCADKDLSIEGVTDNTSEIFKALADTTRLKLLYMIAQRGCRDVCSLDLAEALEISAPTVTHHMKKLIKVGLVSRQQHGKWVHYNANEEHFKLVRELVEQIEDAQSTSAPEKEDSE